MKKLLNQFVKIGEFFFKSILLGVVVLLLYWVNINIIPVQYANYKYKTTSITRGQLNNQIKDQFSLGMSREDVETVVKKLNPNIFMRSDTEFTSLECERQFTSFKCEENLPTSYSEYLDFSLGIPFLQEHLLFGNEYLFFYTLDKNNKLQLEDIQGPLFLDD